LLSVLQRSGFSSPADGDVLMDHGLGCRERSHGSPHAPADLGELRSHLLEVATETRSVFDDPLGVRRVLADLKSKTN
jgi:hypothetical protein